MMYDSWDTKCNRQIFFSHLGPFFTLLPLLPSPNNPKNQNFEKMKQNARDIIILHKSTINDNQDIWFLRYINCNRQNFLSYWDIFCPFTPLTAQKVKISEKWKKHHMNISSFYTTVSKIMIIGYTVPEIWCMTDVMVTFHFGLFLPFYPLNSPKNKNFKK